MDLDSVANDTVLGNHDIAANLESIDNAFLVNVHIVTDGHAHVLQTTIMLCVGWSDDTLFTNDSMQADLNLGKVTSDDGSCLNNCLTVDENLLTTLDEHLSTNLDTLRCDEEAALLVEERVLFDHHFLI